MIIRKMTADDIPELAQLYKEFWNEDSCLDFMYKQFGKLCTTHTHVFLSAIKKDRLVGSVMGVICEELYGDCKPFMVLENMIVDKRYRNKGVGRALITELERIAAEKNCTQIIFVTETNRNDACKFYESAGYNPEKYKGFKKKLI
ncbi:MAG: acetyltransferase [Peptococcaceae bacterium BRH_c8a]|nr:MAG: acetyltransferase [Peptococcaceae bacterium BRH_c8a]